MKDSGNTQWGFCTFAWYDKLIHCALMDSLNVAKLLCRA